MEKICSKCEINKTVAEFYKKRKLQNHSLSNASHICIDCHKAYRTRLIALEKNVPMIKLCPKCKITKTASEFYRNPASLDGLRPRCKTCHNLDNADFGRATRYKLSKADFAIMLQKQDGLCAICSVKLTMGKKTMDNLNVDHNHKTGKIRELLCQTCNKCIGLFKEDIDIMRKAIKYIKKHSIPPLLASSPQADHARESVK